MVRSRSLVALALLAALAAPAAAELCVIDAVPAATILVPYFEVDFRNFGKSKFERTKVTLINTSPAPTIAHVILWTDASFPTLNFDLFLTGFDVQEINIDDIFIFGNIPTTSYPSDFDSSECTQCGESGCSNFSPADSFTVPDLRNSHMGSGVSYYGGQCVGSRSGNVARGYMTIDNVSQCSRLYPFDGGYFENGGTGIANNENVLQATITTYSSRFLREVPAIHIEAGTSDGLSTPGNFTFYGRYRDFDASDNRECGGFSWSMPFRKKNKFKTEAIVWRDSGTTTEPFDCGSNPDWYPLETGELMIWDQQENPREITSEPFPLETQLVPIGKGSFKTGSFDSGWARFTLSEDTTEAVGHGYVISRQIFKKREGDAWADALTQTICGAPVSETMRRRAAGSNRKANRGSGSIGSKRKKIGVDGDVPRPDLRPE